MNPTFSATPLPSSVDLSIHEKESEGEAHSYDNRIGTGARAHLILLKIIFMIKTTLLGWLNRLREH